ncbi:MAG: DNA methyltransferase Dim-2 [Thelocarpon superellum]|nr:MAG: DNA methyltransferase Dim-2 [Thelocarpon superellum]
MSRSQTLSTPSKKRKRHSSGDVSPSALPIKHAKSTGHMVSVRLPNLVFPKSHYAGWRPPLPPSPEEEALEALAEEQGRVMETATHESVDSNDFSSFDVTRFTIYRPSQGFHPDEMAPLHHLCTKIANNDYLLDGIVCEGPVRRYLQRIPFSRLSLMDYGDAAPHPERGHEQIYIQSALLSRRATEVWYRLRDPAPEYRRYHDDFCWLASLAKHVTDFLCRHESVALQRFQQEFYQEIVDLHRENLAFHVWLRQYGDTDFRRAVASNHAFLRNEAWNLDPRTRRHPLWGEIVPTDLAAIKAHPSHVHATVVTPYVYECFQRLPWARCLKAIKPRVSTPTKALIEVSVPTPTRLRWSKLGRPMTRPDKVQVGDVIGVEKDVETRWKGPDAIWFAYVQAIEPHAAGRRYLGVIWLYRPSDTTCSTTHYPHHDELFFSDNCNCGDTPIDPDEVLCTVPVALFSSPGQSGAEYFVRQLYHTEAAAFTTMTREHLRCVHRPSTAKSDRCVFQEKYKVGDTVLYLMKRDTDVLEAGEIVQLSEPVLLRKLLRRMRDGRGGGSIPPNELVYSDELISVGLDHVDRKCLVRFFTQREKAAGLIPPPYNRNGTADAFFITCHLNEGKLRPLTAPFPASLHQAFDPAAAPPRDVLHGLDLFCGGGSFGRGLAEGGAVQHRWAVDYYREAIHTYHANRIHPTALYYGSVNDFLARALEGKFSDTIPAPGQVDLIAAGSPCVAFSNANRLRESEESLQNASLVASVASFVDFYRPQHALLENVLGMAARTGPWQESRNVFSQLVACFAGMGYQVQQFTLDAWSFGSPQSRTRLFISITAPGLVPMEHPALSHSHPSRIKDRSLGTASNNLPFGKRRFEATPFAYVTAKDATSDLPFIGDARSQTCISHPDHRCTRVERNLQRIQLTQIPVAPHGQTFMLAYQRRRLGRPQIDNFKWGNLHKVKASSRSWQRVSPHGLMPTVTTAANPTCAFTGTILHWEQHRLLSVMEQRRAQGYPDHEVLIGNPSDQWKIVGNSVARTVALALGLSLREAWLARPDEAAAAAAGARTMRHAWVEQWHQATRHVGAARPINGTPLDHRHAPIVLSDEEAPEWEEDLHGSDAAQLEREDGERTTLSKRSLTASSTVTLRSVTSPLNNQARQVTSRRRRRRHVVIDIADVKMQASHEVEKKKEKQEKEEKKKQG